MRIEIPKGMKLASLYDLYIYNKKMMNLILKKCKNFGQDEPYIYKNMINLSLKKCKYCGQDEPCICHRNLF